ncbi:MAG: DegV family EDD domain-containing protein [Gemmatimonadetes bacterium]|jgi:DegV family protein with EDD domain|nr:DegV family EDD domain-containing protein [Gemmatimonadota bacterium]MEE2847994.1 DegV family protein [Gemmatimonadota bacterium]|tara:strand:+ start:113 stop:1954 length:1842 start_codon:yes stop_codon:yes gene_type:complete
MAMQIRYLDGPRLRRSLIAACDYAQGYREELNRINVFPVPDGDTGTNLALTVRAIADHLRAGDARGVAEVAHEAAQAAVLGARGNCGMILSHFLLGFADDLSGLERIDTGRFATALNAGAVNLQEALETPVEGTILTVMRDTAEAAAASGDPDFAPLLELLLQEARGSLARTPDLLPVLKKAGVVDAGAKGFVSLLEGVLLFMNGDPLVSLASEAAQTDDAAAVARAEYPGEEEQYRFCTEALVRGEGLPTQGDAREVLRELGDSLIVIRSDDVLKVHVHTDEPEQVFTYLRGVGNLVTHKAEDMRAQHAAMERAADGHIQLARRPVTVVTDSAADLPEEVVRAHGIHVTPLVLVDGDRTYRDGVDISAEEFHLRLASDAELPTTSQPAPADFLDTFGRAAEEGEAVVGVLAGSSLSGTFRSGEAAASRFHGAPVCLADSLGASLLQGLLVLKACELAELAWAPSDIVKEIDRIRTQSGILFTVDTFDRLIASGRIRRGRAFLGRVFGIKPILQLSVTGKVEPVGKALGMDRAGDELMKLLRQRIPTGVEKVRFGVVHVGAPDVVGPATARLRAEYGDHVEILTAPVTPVIATHLGTGAWGVAYVVEDDSALA